MRKIPQGKKIGFLLSNPMLLQGLSGFLPMLLNQGMMSHGNQIGPWGGLNLMGQNPGSNPASSNPSSTATPPPPPQNDLGNMLMGVFGGDDINGALQNAGKMFQAFNDAGLTEQLGPMFKQFQPVLNGLLKASAQDKKLTASKSIGHKKELGTLARYTGTGTRAKASAKPKMHRIKKKTV